MSQVPTPYTPGYSFTTFTESNPTSQQPGNSLDSEFQAIAANNAAIIARAAQIQRDDGQLANGSVGPDQLATTLATAIGIPVAWTPNTVYVRLNSVLENNSWYWCSTSHTSGSVFDASFWTLIGVFGTGVTGAKGDKGDTGNTGVKGDKGDKGDSGTPGATGGVGLPGTPGVNGADGTIIGNASVLLSIRAWGSVSAAGVPNLHNSNGTFGYTVARIPIAHAFGANGTNSGGNVTGAYQITVVFSGAFPPIQICPVVTVWAGDGIYDQAYNRFAVLATNITQAQSGANPGVHKDNAGNFLMLNNLSIGDFSVSGQPDPANNRLINASVPGGSLTDIMLGDRISGYGLSNAYDGQAGSMIVHGIDDTNGYIYGGSQSGQNDVLATDGASHVYTRHSSPSQQTNFLRFTVLTGRSKVGAETHNIPLDCAFSFIVLGN